jgi:hypothetical protein
MVMSLNKFSKIIAICLLAVLLLPTVSVSASSLGWPVDVGATGTGEEVTGEDAPMDAVESTVDVLTGTEEQTGGLGAIDNSTSDLKDDAIFPEDEYGLANKLTAGTTSDELSSAEKIYSNYKDVVPTVTTDQMVEWILKKGNEVISILQIFAQPFAIIIFIVSCAICLIGALTKGNMMGKGLIGMVAAAILYAAALYAPILVNSISSFLAS